MAQQPVNSTLALFGNTQRTGRWRIQGVTAATALFGACIVDLREAELVGQEILVRVTALFGNVTVVVPEDLEVDLVSTALFASVKDLRPKDRPAASGRSIRVEAFALFGSVKLSATPDLDDAGEEVSSIEAVAESVRKERPSLDFGAAPSGTTTVLFSDIEGFSALNDRLGDMRSFDVLRAHNEVVRREVVDHAGYEVKSQGDGFMVAFASARQALLCAIGIQQALAEQGDEPVRVRIGLHTGESIKDADDFFGRNVILAARIADQAQGGEILVSSLVKELVESGGDFAFQNGRELALKGLSGTGKVYSVAWEGQPRG
jgi:class 3 adenylate cyclase